jgi:hypothetical protein
MEGDASKGLEITWGRTFSVWWAFLWRLTLLGGVVGGVGAGVIGMLFALVIGVSVAKIVANLCFYFGLFGASVLVIRGLLSADLGEFSIRLVPNEERREP